jgi:hypothetical protein
MAIYLTDFSRALIRWIPEHFLGHTGYSNGALREASIELREAAEKLENEIAARVAAGANSTGGRMMVRAAHGDQTN